MLHAATYIVPTSSVLTSDARNTVPSPSNLFKQFKFIFSNNLLLVIEPIAISIKQTKTFIETIDVKSLVWRICARCLRI